MRVPSAAVQNRPSLPEGVLERVLACPDVRADAVARGREQVAGARWPCSEELAAALVRSLVDARRSQGQPGLCGPNCLH